MEGPNSRKRTFVAAEGTSADVPPREAAAAAAAQEAVLTNPDLVERILALLPTPLLAFCRPTAGVQRADRWAAGQVSRIFRQASLRLPWEVVWERQTLAGSAGYLALCRPRQLQAASIRCYSSMVAECATLGRLASGVDTLRLCFPSAPTMQRWVRLGGMAPPVRCSKCQTCKRAQCQACGGAPDLAYLSALSDASGSLSLDCERVQDRGGLRIVWLRLREYCGDPVGGLPLLQRLSVSYGPGDEGDFVCPLEAWAGPELTNLMLKNCSLEMPVAGELGQGLVGSPGVTWLTRLQRLYLYHCSVESPGNRGLDELLPCLSYLDITCLWDNFADFPAKSLGELLYRGLPASLQELILSFQADESRDCPDCSELWVAYPRLVDLPSLSVRLEGDWWCVGGEMHTFFAALFTLPRLNKACLCLAADPDEVQDSLQVVQTLLHGRAGKLFFYVPDKSHVADTSSVSSDEDPSMTEVEAT